jgi:hypothetical protein
MTFLPRRDTPVPSSSDSPSAVHAEVSTPVTTSSIPLIKKHAFTMSAELLSNLIFGLALFLIGLYSLWQNRVKRRS